MSVDEDGLVLGGRYQVMPVISIPVRPGEPELSCVFFDLWDGNKRAGTSVRLLPEEARELAQALVDAAHTAELSSKR